MLAFARPCLCLIEVGGNEPMQNHGWPAGSVELANLPTRISWWAGPPFGTGSMYEFQYNCESTAQFNEALTAFAVIKANRLELVVHNGPKIDWLNREEQKRIDWTFTIWNHQNWDHLNNTSRAFYRLPDSDIQKPVPRTKKPVPAPMVEIYVGGSSPIVWEQVKVPKKITVIDKRPGSIASEFAGNGLIRGRVFDHQTKQPLAGAAIVLLKQVESEEESEAGRRGVSRGSYEWKKTTEATTNSDGNCQIDRISLGLYKVRVFADGYSPVELEIYDNRIPEYYNFEAGLVRAFCIKGKVIDAEGNPVEGVAVSAGDFISPDGSDYPLLEESPVVTNTQGQFEISGLPEGFASIRCRTGQWHQTNSIFEMYSVPSDNLKIILEGTATVRGKVVTEKGNKPAGQIVLEIEPPGEEQVGKWGYSGYLSENGSFDISGIPPGEYIISARPNPSSSDYQPHTQKIIVQSGKTYEITITLADYQSKP